MITVYCKTHLDLNCESWPHELPAVPHVGDLIQSKTQHKNDFRLELEVYSVTWKWDKHQDNWYVVLELHLSKFHKLLPSMSNPAAHGSILAFFEWYAPKVGRTVGSFI